MTDVTYISAGLGVGKPLGRYSHVATGGAGRLVVVAGQVGTNRDGELVGPGDARAQTHQAFLNLATILSSQGLGWTNVVKLTSYVVGREVLPEFHAGRGDYFEGRVDEESYPPNTLLVISGLVQPEFLVEVEALALVPGV